MADNNATYLEGRFVMKGLENDFIKQIEIDFLLNNLIIMLKNKIMFLYWFHEFAQSYHPPQKPQNIN